MSVDTRREAAERKRTSTASITGACRRTLAGTRRV